MSARALSLFALIFLANTVTAQPPAAPLAPPQFPTLSSVQSRGLKPGATTELSVSGANLTFITSAELGMPGGQPAIVGKVPDGQTDAAKLRLSFELPKTLPSGIYPLRLVGKYGISNAKPVCVDELREVNAVGTHTTPATAMIVEANTVVVGSIAADTATILKLPVKAKQRLMIEVLAKRIGSPLDPVLIVSDAKSGRPIPGQYADETPGCQGDARLQYTAPSDMELLLTVRDSTYQGGAEHTYRLRIADAPGAMTAFPLAVQRGKPATIGFSGPQADSAMSVTIKDPRTPFVVAPKRETGIAGWPVPVGISDHAELLEVEPNNDRATATKLPVPGGVSAKFGTKGDLDFFVFPAKKGQKLEVIAKTYDVHSPCEVYLKIQDAKGAELAKSNPSLAIAKAEFTAPADGDYYAVAEHLNYLVGPTEVYHLTVQPVTPSFAVVAGVDRVEVAAPNGVGYLPIIGLTKLNGFNSPIELVVESSTLVGTLTIPAGANPLPAKPLDLPISQKPGLKLPSAGMVEFRVKATAKLPTGEVVSFVTAPAMLEQSFGGLPNPTPQWGAEFVAAIVPTPLMQLRAKLETPDLRKGTTIKGTISLVREAKFTDAVTIAITGLPANVTVKVNAIAKDANEATFELTADAKAAAATATLLVRGTAKAHGRDFAAQTTLPLRVVEPKAPEPKKDEPKKKTARPR